MKAFSGRLWLVHQRDSKLRVEIELDDEKIRITSNDNLIGDWPLPDLKVHSITRTEARLAVEGEEFVIFSRDADFMPALAARKSRADSGRVSAVASDYIDSNVVSLDRDRPRSLPVTADPLTHEGQAAAVAGSGGGVDAAAPDRGAHRSEDRMLWKW